MRRTIAIETSQFSTSPTRRWCYGGDCWEEDVEIEYPDEFEHLDDDELLEMADDEISGVHYCKDENVLFDKAGDGPTLLQLIEIRGYF